MGALTVHQSLGFLMYKISPKQNLHVRCGGQAHAQCLAHWKQDGVTPLEWCAGTFGLHAGYKLAFGSWDSLTGTSPHFIPES